MPPSYHHLLVFKCLAYATDVHVTHIFVPRAKCSIFLSYPASKKAYKLDHLQAHKIFTSRMLFSKKTIFLMSPTILPPQTIMMYHPMLSLLS